MEGYIVDYLTGYREAGQGDSMIPTFMGFLKEKEKIMRN
jgi:hypothetical protein